MIFHVEICIQGGCNYWLTENYSYSDDPLPQKRNHNLTSVSLCHDQARDSIKATEA